MTEQPLKAVETWFHLFRSMIESGEVARMKPHAFTCYCVIKAYTNFANGRSFPGVDLIAEKAGMSSVQVKRELKVLEEFGFITKERDGRKNVYTLREKVDIHDDSGRPVAVATWDYIPSSVKQAVADLKNVLVTGNLAGARIVHIENLQVQIIQGTGNTGVMNQDKQPSKMPEMVRDQISALRKTKRQPKDSAEPDLFESC